MGCVDLEGLGSVDSEQEAVERARRRLDPKDAKVVIEERLGPADVTELGAGKHQGIEVEEPREAANPARQPRVTIRLHNVPHGSSPRPTMNNMPSFLN